MYYSIEYQSPSTLSGTEIWIDINNVYDFELTNNVTESDNRKETTETALNENKEKQEKLKKLKRLEDNNVYKTVKSKNQKWISVSWFAL